MTCITNSIKIREVGGYVIAIPFLVSNDQYRVFEEKAHEHGRTVEEELILSESSKIV